MRRGSAYYFRLRRENAAAAARRTIAAYTAAYSVLSRISLAGTVRPYAAEAVILKLLKLGIREENATATAPSARLPGMGPKVRITLANSPATYIPPRNKI